MSLSPAKMKTKISVDGQDGALIAHSNDFSPVEPNNSMALVRVRELVMDHDYMILLVTVMVHRHR
jgi:hypothetical protein